MERSGCGICISIIGLFFLGYHMVQYIDLIESINALASLFGISGVDTDTIVGEIVIGFIITVTGIILMLPSLEKGRIEKVRMSNLPGIQSPIPPRQFCVECGNGIIGKYCPNCGRKALEEI